MGIFTALGFSDAGLSAAHYEFAQTRGQLTRQLKPVHAGKLAFEQGWFSLIALRGPRPVCVTGKYSWTSFRQGPSGALIALKGRRPTGFAICDLRGVLTETKAAPELSKIIPAAVSRDRGGGGARRAAQRKTRVQCNYKGFVL